MNRMTWTHFRVDRIKLLHALGACIIALPAIGCSATAEPEESTNETSDSVRAQLSDYVSALDTQNLDALDSLLSSELKSRIAASAGTGAYRDKLARFAQVESGKLAREIPNHASAGANVTISSIETTPQDGVFAAHAIVAGTTLPKAIYFVREGDAYRLNVVPPQTLRGNYSTYKVHNTGGTARNVSCSGYGPYSISGNSTRGITCYDSCGSWFDGSHFYGPTNDRRCDWNSWGQDVSISQDGTLHCSDPC